MTNRKARDRTLFDVFGAAGGERTEVAMRRWAMLMVAALIAVGAAIAFILQAYKAELTQARRILSAGARLANTSTGLIEYAVNGAGTPLLSIHGAGGGYDQGLANAVDLVGGNYHVIAPSRFGYLGTPVLHNPSSALQADAHASLLAALCIDKAIVVGISAGARSAIELAIRHPKRVAALILIVPGTYAPTSPVSVEGSRASTLVLWLVNSGADFTWWALEKIVPSILVRFVGVPPDLFTASPQAERDRVMQIVRSIEPLSWRYPGINIDSNPDSDPPRLAAIAAPTLVISVRDDLFNTLPAAEFAAANIPKAKLVVYDTGGHLLVGRQLHVREVVSDFIANHVRLDR